VTQPAHEHGSLSQEAALLAEAVQEWMQGASRRTPGADQRGAERQDPLCPACQLLRVVRSAKPEVYAHLADAASSLAAALRELVSDADTRETGETGESQPRPRSDVEHIDLA
jgi:hypothetical protein